MKTFKARITVPEKTNRYFIRKSAKGLSPCIAGKPEFFKGSVLSNCVGYAFGRCYEILGYEPKLLNWRARSAPPSAQFWFDNAKANGLEVGQVAKLGSVACWYKKANGKITTGHVAVVEEVAENGNYASLVSESGYGSYSFRTRNYGPKMKKGTGWHFQGYIYLPEQFEKEKEIVKVGDFVRILEAGNSQASGRGKKLSNACVGWRRQVLGFANGEYRVRLGLKGITTGYFKEGQIEKL